MHPDDKVRADFHAALDTGNLDGVKKMTLDFPDLIKQGWNLGGAIQNLVFAAQKGNLPLMQLLVKLGCDINAADERAGHISPLSSAAYWGQESIVRWLLAEGVSVDGVCHAVSTPLIAAATRGHIKIIEILLDHGAEINREHLKLPQTALDFAVLYSNMHATPGEAASLLRKRGGIRPYGERNLWPLPYGADLISEIEQALTACVNPLTVQETEWGAIAKTRIPKKYDAQLIFTVPQQNEKSSFALCLPSEWPLNKASLQVQTFNWPIQLLAKHMESTEIEGNETKSPFKYSIAGKDRWFFLAKRNGISSISNKYEIFMLIPIQEKNLKKLTDQVWVDKQVEGKWSNLTIDP